MEDKLLRAILDKFGRDQRSRKCPRCGDMHMGNDVRRNALSRQANVYVCDVCGVEEAIRDRYAEPLPLELWAYFTEGAEKYE